MIKSLSELRPGDHIKWHEERHILPPEIYETTNDLELIGALENRAHHAIVLSSSKYSVEVVHNRNGWITTDTLDREPNDLYVLRYTIFKPDFTVNFAEFLTTKDPPPNMDMSAVDAADNWKPPPFNDIFGIPTEKRFFKGCHNYDGSAFKCQCEEFAEKVKGKYKSSELKKYIEKLKAENASIHNSVEKLLEETHTEGVSAAAAPT